METAFMFDTDDDGQNVCFTCNGSGVKLVCCDDICLGQGYCMHGDGEETCPACHGSGEGGVMAETFAILKAAEEM